MATTPVMLGTGTKPDRRPIALLPITIATSAVTIGRLIATREPKAMARMRTAIRMPISSLLPPAGARGGARPPPDRPPAPAPRRAPPRPPAAGDRAAHPAPRAQPPPAA